MMINRYAVHGARAWASAWWYCGMCWGFCLSLFVFLVSFTWGCFTLSLISESSWLPAPFACYVCMSCSDSCQMFMVQRCSLFLTVPAMWRRRGICQRRRLGTLLQQTPTETEIHLRTSLVLPSFRFLYELCMTTRARSRMSWASKQVHRSIRTNAQRTL